VGGALVAQKGRYRENLHEDFRIRDFINKETERAGISKIEIERYPSQVVVTIFTAKPGIVIGRKGEAVKKIRQGLEDLTTKKVKVEVEEIEKPDLDAKLVAENIVGQLERRIGHSRAMKRAISRPCVRVLRASRFRPVGVWLVPKWPAVNGRSKPHPRTPFAP